MLPGMSPGLSKPAKFKALRRLVQEFRADWGAVGIVLVLGLCISAVQPISVKITQLIIDQLQGVGGQGTEQGFSRWLPLALVGLFVLSGLGKYVYNVTRRTICERVLMRLRERLFAQYVHLPMRTFDSTRTGEMLSGIQNDLQQINQGFDTLWDLLKEPFTFLGLVGAAFYFDWKLALVTLVVVPPVIWIFARSGAAVKRYTGRNLAHYSDLVSLSGEAIQGARVVKVFGLERFLQTRFERIQKQYFDTALKSIRVQEITTPMVELIGAALMAGVIWYGGHRASLGELSAGDLVAFIIALGLSQMPIKRLNNANLKLRAAEAAADRIYAVLETPRTRASGTRRIQGIERGIVYDNVSLEYDGQPALHGVSFEVQPNTRVALVGQSGGGKTSIVNLLPRLYEISGGRILIDGEDIRNLDLAALRALVSYVTQDVFLFHGTVWENIRMGCPDATEAEITCAARQAQCMDFVERLPEGPNTLIGERGMRLSGGERQRLAIARAFLKQAPLLILDEATSSLDSNSEAKVQQALELLMEGRTVLIVAHRFSTVRGANQILVVQQGRILERGDHESLIQRAGVYHQLWEAQGL